jgi:hypothetical protein
LVTSVVGGEVVKRVGFVLFGGQAVLPGVQAGVPQELGDHDQVGLAAQTGLVANVCLRTWAAGSSSSAARFGYRDQHHLPLAWLEVELHLARDRAGDALAVAGQALDRFAC